MTQYFEEYGPRLAELGYTVLPIKPGTKRPDLKNWNTDPPNLARVRQGAVNGWAKHGTGVHAAHTPLIDVDVLDPEIADQMSRAIDSIFPDTPLMTRTGLAPKFGVPMRSDTPFKKLTSKVYTDGTREHKVEILGDGQQWVAYADHPETGRPYVWFDGLGDEGLVGTPLAALPELTREDALRVVGAFEALAAARVASGLWRAVSAPPVERERPVADDPFAAHAPPTDLTRAQVEWVLAKTPNVDVDYDRWFAVISAVHHELAEDGEDVARAWSTESHKHTDEKFDLTWHSLGRYTGPQTTMRSLLKETGQPPAGKPEPTSVDLAFAFHPGDDYSEDFTGGPEIVEDVLPAQGIAMMFGPSGKGKTFWMLDLAFHVHNGERWRDKEVARGDVMYVAAEAGRGIKKRIQAVKVLHPDWHAPFIADAAPNLSSLTSVEAVRDAARAAGSPAMLIIDTMSASFEGDDSSQQDVAKMMRNLKLLADDLQCLVVFVHHTTKEGSSWRGSGVLFADVDAVLELTSEGEGAERKQWVTQRKHREGEDGKAYPFSLKVSEPLAVKPNGKPITSCTVEQQSYAPAPRKEGRKPRSGDFETSHNYEKARHFLHVIEEMCGLEVGLSLQEDEVIAAIRKDKTVNPMEEPDYPLKKNIIPTLRTLASLGKISKEGRNIRLC